ncbi:MAG: YggU family protein [Gammaproteobacteria bacterium]|nr:YggU family protein [Gammaproteobacteria bacterium]
MSVFFKWQNDDLILNVRVQPRAANDAFAEYNDEFIKIRITAPPVDGKANKHLIAFLAKTFKVAKSSIELLSGETGRNKRLLIHQPKVLPDAISQHMA